MIEDPRDFPADDAPLRSAEDIVGKIRRRVTSLPAGDAELIHILLDHLITTTPAADAVDRATDAIAGLADERAHSKAK